MPGPRDPPAGVRGSGGQPQLLGAIPAIPEPDDAARDIALQGHVCLADPQQILIDGQAVTPQLGLRHGQHSALSWGQTMIASIGREARSRS